MVAVFSLLMRQQLNVSQWMDMRVAIPDGSVEDSRKAQEVASHIDRGATKCYQELRGSFKEQCINLDGNRRVHLAVMLMICQQDRDGRAKTLPAYDHSNSSLFTSALTPEEFVMYTGIFTNIDVVCFHVAKEGQALANLAKVDRVYHASALAGQFLDESKEMLVNMTRTVMSQLTGIHTQMAREQERIREIQERVTTVTQHFHDIVHFARAYDASVLHFNMHIQGLVASLVLSLVIRRCVLPTLSLSCVFLFFESKFGNGHPVIVTWCYRLLFAAIHVWAAYRKLRRYWRRRSYRRALASREHLGPKQIHT
jgi:hypothetical protein